MALCVLLDRVLYQTVVFYDATNGHVYSSRSFGYCETSQCMNDIDELEN